MKRKDIAQLQKKSATAYGLQRTMTNIKPLAWSNNTVQSSIRLSTNQVIAIYAMLNTPMAQMIFKYYTALCIQRFFSKTSRFGSLYNRYKTPMPRFNIFHPHALRVAKQASTDKT